ncbi:MAG: type IV secretory system conjugative DNA transfer family protein, partial [Pseudomonadota bacterium]
MGIYEDLGQGRFATSQESKSVGLYVQGGIHTGFDGQVPLYNHTQSPMILVAGSGGRKGAGFVVWNVVNYPGSMLVNDDKVELARIAMAHQHKLGIEMRCYNPYDKHDVPDHGCNPLDILDTKDPMYHSYVQRFSENFVQLSGAPSGKFFEEFGQRWFSGGMKFDLGMRGHTSLSHLYDLFNTLQYDTDAFKKITQAMMRSSLR